MNLNKIETYINITQINKNVALGTYINIHIARYIYTYSIYDIYNVYNITNN